MASLVLWGATGQAKVLSEFVPRLGYDVIALVDRDPKVASPLLGVPIFRSEAELDEFLVGRSCGALSGAAAIGGWRGRDRLEILTRILAKGMTAPALVHPAAWVADDAVVASGAQILGGANVAAQAQIGEGAIVNTGASVDHECIVGRGAHIASGAVLAGCVEIGERAFVGPGAVVVARVRIGADAIVGAGAVVTRDIPEAVVAYGAPARVIRTVKGAA